MGLVKTSWHRKAAKLVCRKWNAPANASSLLNTVVGDVQGLYGDLLHQVSV